MPQLTQLFGNLHSTGLSALPAKNKKLKKQQTEDMNRVFKDLPKHGKIRLRNSLV